MTPTKVIQGGVCASYKVVLYWLALALFLPALVARADLQFDAFVGYDQILPEHGWFPIVCELHNDGPSFNAVIEVTAGDWGGGQIRRLPIDLPTNTRKRVVIPVFSSGRIWNARLVDSHGDVRAEQSASNAKVMEHHLPLVAALARTVGGMPVFPETANNQWGSRYVAARLQSALFPDNPLTLEGIDMLYLSSEKAADLSIGQVTALEAWLQDGGHLVVGVEQIGDIAGTPWLREMLPCELTATANVASHDGLQEWIRSRPSTPVPVQTKKVRHPNTNSVPGMMRPPRAGPPPGSPRVAPVSDSPLVTASPEDIQDDDGFDAAPLQVATGTPRDGIILIGDSTAPLAFQGKRGRGRITVLGFSPEREPFLSWKNRAWFGPGWRKCRQARSGINPRKQWAK